jgi:hypothetical protein
MKLLVLIALGLFGGVAWMGIHRARAEDLMPLVRTSVVALSVLTLGAVAVLASDTLLAGVTGGRGPGSGVGQHGSLCSVAAAPRYRQGRTCGTGPGTTTPVCPFHSHVRRPTQSADCAPRCAASSRVGRPRRGGPLTP